MLIDDPACSFSNVSASPDVKRLRYRSPSPTPAQQIAKVRKIQRSLSDTDAESTYRVLFRCAWSFPNVLRSDGSDMVWILVFESVHDCEYIVILRLGFLL